MENLLIREVISQQILSSIDLKKKILSDENFLSQIECFANEIVKVFKGNNKIMIAGNGGSAADSQHIAGEFVSRFYFDRPGLPAIALTTDTSILTAIGNDYGFDRIFSRQIQALGMEGDLFLGISTSGKSRNIINAFSECRKFGIKTACLTGVNENPLKEFSDFCIMVPSCETPRIQEGHILVGHILCGIVEEAIYGQGFS